MRELILSPFLSHWHSHSLTYSLTPLPLMIPLQALVEMNLKIKGIEVRDTKEGDVNETGYDHADELITQVPVLFTSDSQYPCKNHSVIYIYLFIITPF